MTDEIKLPRDLALSLGNMLMKAMEPKTEIYFDNGNYDRVWLNLEDGKLKVRTSGSSSSEKVFDPAKTKISFGKPDRIYGRGSSYIEVSSGRKKFKSDVTSLYLYPALAWDELEGHMDWLGYHDAYDAYAECKEKLSISDDEGINEEVICQLWHYEPDEKVTFLEKTYDQCVSILRHHGIHVVTHNDFKAFIEAGVEINGGGYCL